MSGLRHTITITTAEALAVRRGAAIAGGDGGAAARLSTRADYARVAGGYRYNVLRVVPGFRRTGSVAQGLTQHDGKPSGMLNNQFRSLTLPRRPRCRHCAQLIEPGMPVIEFLFFLNQDHPTDALMHGDPCPTERGSS